MAPYKLEDNIREKLEEREIKPSANAWEKLETKLNAAQPKKKPVLWYYIAASFLGILILSSVFLSRNNSEGNNKIVNETIEPQNSEKQVEIISNTSKTEEIVSIENDSEKVENFNAKEIEKQKININKPKPLQQQKSEIDKKINKTEMVAKASDVKQKQIITEKSIISEEEKHFNTKVDEVVASVKKLQENNAEITVTEVEALLNNARRDIQTERILNSSKVDATALLQDVEWELEKSFRDKVFDALGEGFTKIRTAVIERND
jgi:hypothetical protein